MSDWINGLLLIGFGLMSLGLIVLFERLGRE
jgi:hypothetical protein